LIAEDPVPGCQRLINVYDLGTTGYGDVHRLQRRLQAQRRDGGGADALLLTEHRPVITLGRAHPEPNLKCEPGALERLGIQVVQTERGGDITYHGPGQLVAYGIVDLRGWQCSVLDYVSGLEDTAIAVLADWGIRGERSERGRGVWASGRKVASVGLNVRRWITMHGIALNVDPDMTHFSLINPCGMPDVEVTSLSAEVGKLVPLAEVRESFVFHFARIFDCQATRIEVPGPPAGARQQ
jgi:lipoic acid synthetase